MSKRLSPVAVTQPFDFGVIAVHGGNEMLFSVRGGIPVNDAFNQLYCYLSTAKDVIEMVADSDEGREGTGWAASQLLDIAMGLSQSMHLGVRLHEKSKGASNAE